MTKQNAAPVLPDTCLLEITGTSKFGDLIASTVEPKDNPEGLKIYVLENKRVKPALALGDKFIGKLTLKKDACFVKPLSRLANPGDAKSEEIVCGIIEQRGDKLYLKSSEKSSYMDYLIDRPNGAKPGDFIKVSLTGNKRFKEARIVKNFGPFDLNKATSSLILEKYDIPYEFPHNVNEETKNLPEFSKKDREDLTDIPLVTIDGESAKDFDDAVYAKKTDDGFLLIVAIADVAFYVRPDSALDKESYKRGNSVYLPNMVVPMLPEVLCNGLCSLRPNELRASIACFINIDKDGNVQKFDFKRAVIKSAARLTYGEVQAALDGKKSKNITPVMETVTTVYEAYQALRKAREKRGALNLETDEFIVRLNKEGLVLAIEKEEHFISHEIVEEFMVAANVCAAETLGKSKLPTMYRIHEKPLEERLKDIVPLLHNLHMKLPEISALRPEHFNKIIELCSANGYNQGISELILRLQCQAKYSPINMGHFGLGLKDYAHFTSPIRRYADLLIHRALVKAYEMPEGGELPEDLTVNDFEDIGEHLGITERKATNAERDIIARFISAFLTPSIGSLFEVKISGMSSAGIFVRIDNLGAEGLIPMSSLPNDTYALPSGNMELVGETTGRRFKFGDSLKVKLLEASPITGGLIFKYIDEEEGTDYIEKGGSFRGGFKKVRAQKKAKTRHEGEHKGKASQKKESYKNKEKSQKTPEQKAARKAAKKKIKAQNNAKKKSE